MLATMAGAWAGAIAWRATGRAFADGNAAQRAARKPVPLPDSCELAAQWCCPLRRQQAARFDCASAANTTGPISEKLSQATIRIAARRCISLSI
jgi:hypothetical protein